MADVASGDSPKMVMHKNPLRKSKSSIRNIAGPPGTKTWFFFIWLRRNWFLAALILLAMAGVALSILLYLEPCEKSLIVTNTTEVVYNPADVMLLLDESGSIAGGDCPSDYGGGLENCHWLQVKQAASILTETFDNATLGDYQSGVIKWSSRTAPDFSIQLQANTTYVMEQIEGLIQDTGGTYIAPALSGCMKQLEDYGQSPNTTLVNTTQTYQLCVLVTDGFNYDNTGPYDETDSTGTWEFCQSHLDEGVDCNVDNVAAQIRAEGIYILGVFVCLGGFDCSEDNLKSYVTCDDYYNATTGVTDYEECPYFVSIASFDDLIESAEKIADTLASEVGGVGFVRSSSASVCTGDANTFFFLFLVWPLLVYLFFKPIEFCIRRCLRKRRKEVVGDAQPGFEMPEMSQAAVIDIPPEEPVMAMEVAQPMPVPDDGKKYKWEIKASDQYLWSMGGGTTPMKVDYGSSLPPPPSAPQEDVRRRKTVTETEWVELMDKESYDNTAEMMAAVYSGGDWQEDVSKRCCPCCWDLEGDDEEVRLDAIEEGDEPPDEPRRKSLRNSFSFAFNRKARSGTASSGRAGSTASDANKPTAHARPLSSAASMDNSGAAAGGAQTPPPRALSTGAVGAGGKAPLTGAQSMDNSPTTAGHVVAFDASNKRPSGGGKFAARPASEALPSGTRPSSAGGGGAAGGAADQQRPVSFAASSSRPVSAKGSVAQRYLQNAQSMDK